ncbi:lamin tail domain-containing protein [Paenibacillus prosopidis]|uniref:phospholipase D n=1 Tax=Paenibacillus prosopidis TaxID=630520 RepID=A0A368WCS7_9BACL|nr:lamin tail domain-containing protein [Paenibacillus prosopidis]RCW51937.1 phosphatidylserine/phosphatidylglycerophosphate/cardiolipin synthase-like enzyme [Paenibacillus prosopidis]
MKKIFLLFLTMMLAISIFPGYGSAAQPTHVIISEVYYDTNLSYEPEEYVAITNPTGASVDISNWAISNGSYEVKFPAGTSIASGITMYIAKDASKFKGEMVTIVPSFEYGTNSDAAIPQMVVSGSTPTFANTGDEVLLKNGAAIVDAVLYGTSTYSCSCWSGTAASDVSEGIILVRDRVESSGEWEDSDSVADWDGLRVYQAGQSRFDTPTFTFTGDVTAYTSPDSSYSTLTSLLNSATTSIDLNLYEFHNTYLLASLKNAITRGVAVRVFLEGQPVGGLTDQSKYVSKEIVDAGGQVRYIISDTANERFKRYRFDHAKYGIIDGQKVFLQSENWKETGVPTTNTFGNRGWGIIINNADYANYVKNVFNTDWNIEFKDSFPYTPGTAYGEPSAGFVPDTSNPGGSYATPFSNQTFTGTMKVTPVFAPDSTFLKEKAIIGMMRNATKSLYVEQLYIHKHWGSSASGSPATDPNIYLEEVIDAARRGVEVRVILDSAFLDASDTRDNQYTVQYINDTASAEGLNMSAKLIDLPTTHLEKVHNKGMIADGNKVLVSSINWSENSPVNNREAGVIVENSQVANYYENVFWWDWNAGQGTSNPAAIKISEVYYDTVGNDDVEEYVELYNPTSATVDISGWTISDNAGTFTFPSGKSIPGSGYFTVARNASGFNALFGKQPSLSGMTLSLSNSGDKMTLKDASGSDKDFVAWENYVSGWSLTANIGKSIYRTNPNTDTDTNADWISGNPTP